MFIELYYSGLQLNSHDEQLHSATDTRLSNSLTMRPERLVFASYIKATFSRASMHCMARFSLLRPLFDLNVSVRSFTKSCTLVNFASSVVCVALVFDVRNSTVIALYYN